MTQKQRSLVSKNSNSFNAVIKKTSVTFTNANLKKIAAITTAIIMLSATGTFGFSPIEEAFAKGKPQDVQEWSNGFPSGPHWNLNIHGKKLDPFFNCDNSQSSAPFGASVFLPLNTTEAKEMFPEEPIVDLIGDINFVSNKRSNVQNLTVIDPCGAPFGSEGDPDEILVQYPYDMEAQVYWRILGNHGGGPNKEISNATISHPALLDTCDFLPTQYEDGSVVQWYDPDCTDCDTAPSQLLDSFLNGTEMYEDFTMTDSVFSLNETIYSKAIPVGVNLVQVDDIRVANANNTSWEFLDDSMVLGGDFDFTNITPLFNFTNNFKYNDTDISGNFTVGETVYKSDDNKISPGDIRMANAASVGLDETAGGQLLSCEGSEQLVGLGLVSNKGVFGISEDGVQLERFGDQDNENEKNDKGGKKGKSVAMNVTGLFKWTGSVCEAEGLDDNGDNKLTFDDFDVVAPFGNITSADLDYLNNTLGFVIDSSTLDDIGDNDGGIETQAEFDVWITIALADLADTDGNLLCRAYTDDWIFNVADIVLYGFDYENKGSSLTQMRFYPIDTTSYDEG